MARHSNVKGVAWIALIISIVALVTAWISLRRTTAPDIPTQVEDAVNAEFENMDGAPNTTSETDQATATVSTSSEAATSTN